MTYVERHIEAIADTDRLYRRIPIVSFNPDGTVNSAAFKRNNKPDPSISVDLEWFTTAEETLTRGATGRFGIGSLVAAAPRQLGFSVRHAPASGNWSHSLIEGQNSREMCRRLAETVQVIIRP